MWLSLDIRLHWKGKSGLSVIFAAITPGQVVAKHSSPPYCTQNVQALLMAPGTRRKEFLNEGKLNNFSRYCERVTDRLLRGRPKEGEATSFLTSTELFVSGGLKWGLTALTQIAKNKEAPPPAGQRAGHTVLEPSRAHFESWPQRLLTV